MIQNYPGKQTLRRDISLGVCQQIDGKVRGPKSFERPIFKGTMTAAEICAIMGNI